MQDGLDPSVQLMLSADPSGFLDQATTQHQASVSEAGALKALQQAERTLNRQKQDAAATLAQLDSTTAALNGAKAQVQAKLQQSQSLLNSLTAGQRAALLAAQQDGEGGEVSRGSTRADLASLPQASGQAGAAVQAALSRLGDPYLWGAGGPTAFDCSGLTQWAYAQAGIQLPRTSQEQATVGIAVPGLGQAQPGDLVIYNAEEARRATWACTSATAKWCTRRTPAPWCGSCRPTRCPSPPSAGSDRPAAGLRACEDRAAMTPKTRRRRPRRRPRPRPAAAPGDDRRLLPAALTPPSARPLPRPRVRRVAPGQASLLG